MFLLLFWDYHCVSAFIIPECWVVSDGYFTPEWQISPRSVVFQEKETVVFSGWCVIHHFVNRRCVISESEFAQSDVNLRAEVTFRSEIFNRNPSFWLRFICRFHVLFQRGNKQQRLFLKELIQELKSNISSWARADPVIWSAGNLNWW